MTEGGRSHYLASAFPAEEVALLQLSPTIDFAFANPQIVAYIVCIFLFLVLLVNTVVHQLYGIGLARKITPLIFLNLGYCGGVLVTFSGLVTNSSAVVTLSINGFLGGLTCWMYIKALIFYFGLDESALLWPRRFLFVSSVLSLWVAVFAGVFPDFSMTKDLTLIGANEISKSLFVGLGPAPWTVVPVLFLMVFTAWVLFGLLFLVWKFRDREPILFAGVIISIFAMLNDIGIGMGVIQSEWLLTPVGYLFEIMRFQWVMVAQAHRKIARLNREVEVVRNAHNSFALIRLIGHDLRRAIRRMREAPHVEANQQVVDRLTGLIEESSVAFGQREPVYLRKLIEEILAFHQTDILRAGIEVQWSCAENLKIKGFRSDLYFALSNLFLNSIQAVENSKIKLIRVVCTQQDGAICIMLSDSGPGFSPEARESLFELPQVPSGQGGKGVGLVVVQELLKRSSGFISLDAGPDTQFVIKFF